MALFSNNQSAVKSTQSFLDVSEVRDGVVIMKDGNLRSILAVSSVNFALKSEDEQNAIIASYRNFLNSIDFPVQILMQSRRMDVSPYLDVMKDRLATVTNKLLQVQIAEYIDFISQLVSVSHIMSKSFYVIVPFNYNKIKEGVFSKFSKIFGGGGGNVILDVKNFEEHKKKLQERTGFIKGQLASLGVDAIELNTEEAIELLYSSYNIGAAPNIHGEALSKLDISNQ